MKHLLLLRHAKAVAKDAARDFERPLSARGRAEMEAIAAHLAEAGIRPDLALVSSAARTRETWQLTRLDGVPVRYEEGIYHGEAADLLALVRGVEDTAERVILVGHNPSIEELGNGLVAAGAPGPFPTAALLTVAFAAASWSAIAEGAGRAEAFVTPETLAAA